MENNANVSDFREVDVYGQFVLLIEGHEVHYGPLDDLKKVIASYIESGGDVSDCEIGEFSALQNVIMDTRRTVYIPLRSVDEEADEYEAEYQVNLRGTEYESFCTLENAVDCVAELLVEEQDLDPLDVEILKIATLGCSFEPEIENFVDITIPAQEMVKASRPEEIELEVMSRNELYEMQRRINDILCRRYNKSAEVITGDIMDAHS